MSATYLKVHRGEDSEDGSVDSPLVASNSAAEQDEPMDAVAADAAVPASDSQHSSASMLRHASSALDDGERSFVHDLPSTESTGWLQWTHSPPVVGLLWKLVQLTWAVIITWSVLRRKSESGVPDSGPSSVTGFSHMRSDVSRLQTNLTALSVSLSTMSARCDALAGVNDRLQQLLSASLQLQTEVATANATLTMVQREIEQSDIQTRLSGWDDLEQQIRQVNQSLLALQLSSEDRLSQLSNRSALDLRRLNAKVEARADLLNTRLMRDRNLTQSSVAALHDDMVQQSDQLRQVNSSCQSVRDDVLVLSSSMRDANTSSVAARRDLAQWMGEVGLLVNRTQNELHNASDTAAMDLQAAVTQWREELDKLASRIRPHGKVTYLSDGNFTVPDGVHSVQLTGVAGGGGCRPGAINYVCGGGGGAGVRSKSVTVQPGDFILIRVGAGGLSRGGQQATAGGDTSFGSLLTLTGGGVGGFSTNPRVWGCVYGAAGDGSASSGSMGQGGGTLFGTGASLSESTSARATGYGGGAATAGGSDANGAASGFLTVEWD